MVKGILLDKDGTIIDFFSIWPDIARQMVPRLIRQNELQDSNGKIEKDIFSYIGFSNGEVDPKKGFAYKSYGDIAQDIVRALEKNGINLDLYSIYMQIVTIFNTILENESPKYKTFTDMEKLLSGLKKKGYYLGIATSDMEKPTIDCLKKLNILEYFDYIGCDDGKRKHKPDGQMIEEFCELCGINPEEVVMVGDTYNDMIFAKNNGAIPIAVLSGVSKKEDFENIPKLYIDDLESLPQAIENLNFNK